MGHEGNKGQGGCQGTSKQCCKGGKAVSEPCKGRKRGAVPADPVDK